MNTTIRENILFGKEYNEQKYKEIIKMCELEHDLNQLEGKDQTEIGARVI